jgi:hemoglobin
MRKTAHLCSVLCLLALLLCATAASVQAQNNTAHRQADSLYKRLGGYDALAAVSDEFLGRLMKDEKLGKFFNGVSLDSQKRIRQLVVDQLCAATGGPCIYIGRNMRTVHEGLGITDSDWEIAVKHLIATLDKFKVGKAEKDDLIKALAGLKKDIVDKP